MTETSATAFGHLLNTLLVLSAPLVLGLLLWRRWYRLGDVRRRAIVIDPVTGVVLFAGMYFMGILGAAIVRWRLLGDSAPTDASQLTLPDLARLLIGSATAQSIAVAGYVWIAGRSPKRGRQPAPGAALIGVAVFALVWPLTAGASFVGANVASRVRGEPVETIAHDTLQMMADSPADGWFVLMIVLLVAVVPIMEEVLYRGILQRALGALGLSAWPAILLTSVIFALMHLEVARWHALPALFVLSIGFGWAYEKTGRLIAPMVMHMLFNAGNLVLVWLTACDGLLQ